MAYKMPCVSQPVLEELDMISEDDDPEMIQEFFNNFGTHFIKGIKMGAKFIAKTKFKTSTQEIMKSKGKTVGYDASISAFGFTVGGSKSTTKDQT